VRPDEIIKSGRTGKEQTCIRDAYPHNKEKGSEEGQNLKKNDPEIRTKNKKPQGVGRGYKEATLEATYRASAEVRGLISKRPDSLRSREKSSTRHRGGT